MKAYWINAKDQTITAVDYEHGDLQKLVEGWIETAFMWPSGDVLYVDEEGLLKHPQHFFRIPERRDQPLAGNGVLVGRELNDTDITAPPRMSLDNLTKKVRFGTVRGGYLVWQ